MSFPRKVIEPSSKAILAIVASLALIDVGACAPQSPGEATESVGGAVTTPPPAVDILFMIDNSSSMTAMQAKMLAQIPTFIQSLQTLPQGLPDIHLAVISSDLGAPSDQGASGIGCTTSGDNGNFFYAPKGTCTNTTLQAGATFITDNASGTTKNFTAADPAGLAETLQCIALLGSSGCGFEHQLASVARALGADGSPPPAVNAGFLRPEAELAIVLLTNEDDCSAPASASPLPLYSLNGDNTNDINTPAYPGGPPDGPIANYRCNGGPLGGHLCADPTGPLPSTLVQPPLNPPADALGNSPPTVALTNCESNENSSSGLLSVGSLIAGIKALKTQPNSSIVVGAIMAPSTPYVVQWFPGAGPAASQLWPSVKHSCVGTNGDGSFGDPPVRIAQFVQAFGDNGVTESICDNSYAPAFELVASKIAAHLPGASPGGAGGGNGTPGRDAGAGMTGTGGVAGAPGGQGQGGATGGTGAVSGSGAVSGGAGIAGGAGVAGSAGTSGGGGTGVSGGGISGGGVSGGGGGVAGVSGGGGTTPAGGAGGHAGASRDGGSQDSGEKLGSGSGCGCETGGPSTNVWSFTPLVGLFLVCRARRTRRRR